MRFIKTVVTLVTLGALGITNVSNATPTIPVAASGTEGFRVFVDSTEDIIATFLGDTAAFNNDLYLNDILIFNNKTSKIDDTKNLGSFSIGTELVFRLHVNDTNTDFFTGGNHARADEDSEAGTTLVSFEDHMDLNYKDMSFSFTNTSTGPVPEPITRALATPVPEPATLALIGLGLVGIGLRRYKAA